MGGDLNPTGRAIYLSDDCPLFDEPMFAPALIKGEVACPHTLFESIAVVIKEVQGDDHGLGNQ